MLHRRRVVELPGSDHSRIFPVSNTPPINPQPGTLNPQRALPTCGAVPHRASQIDLFTTTSFPAAVSGVSWMLQPFGVVEFPGSDLSRIFPVLDVRCSCLGCVLDLSHRMCLLVIFRKSTPPQNRRLVVYYH